MDDTHFLSSHLLHLPYEIRQQIYTHLFNPPPTFTIHATVTHRSRPHIAPHTASASIHRDHTFHLHHRLNKIVSSTSTSNVPSSGALLACRQLHSEILPYLLRSLVLNCTFDAALHGPPLQPHLPSLNQHLPAKVLRNLRSVTYHFPLLEPAAASARGQGHNQNHQRPSKTPFPFRDTPNLKRFCLVKGLRVNVDVLYDESSGRVTRGSYLEMGTAEKLRVWERTGLCEARGILGVMGRFGCGGWVSALCLPEIYGSGRRGSWGDWTGDNGEKNEDGDVVLAEKGLGVPLGCDVVVEADVMLFAGQSWRPVHIETLVIEVEVRGKRVRSKRFLEEQEMLARKRLTGLA